MGKRISYISNDHKKHTKDISQDRQHQILNDTGYDIIEHQSNQVTVSTFEECKINIAPEMVSAQSTQNFGKTLFIFSFGSITVPSSLVMFHRRTKAMWNTSLALFHRRTKAMWNTSLVLFHRRSKAMWNSTVHPQITYATSHRVSVPNLDHFLGPPSRLRLVIEEGGGPYAFVAVNVRSLVRIHTSQHVWMTKRFINVLSWSPSTESEFTNV